MKTIQITFSFQVKKVLVMSLLIFYCGFTTIAQTSNEAPLSEFSLSFMPDYTFTGSSLDGWRVLGDVKWSAENGEIIGIAKANSQGGWLILEDGYQDIGIRTLFKTSGSAQTAILFRMEPTEAGYRGVLLTLNSDEVKPYLVSLDAKGNEISREELRRAGGISYRMAPPPPPEDEANRRRNFNFERPEPPSDLPLTPPNTDFRMNDWNQIESFLETSVIRNFLNDGGEVGGAIDGDYGLDGFGPIALYAGGNGEVRFKEFSYKDISIRYTPKETSSDQFDVQCINEFYYSWGSAADDFNRDGAIDIIAGPYIYFGPDFTHFKEIYPAIAKGPSLEFSGPNHQFSHDVNGDGWPDVITGWTVPTVYINPGKESRRWSSYSPVGRTQSETTLFVDIDKDGEEELVYAAGGQFRYAKPVADKEWQQINISETGYHTAHGIGTGDINGDGLTDVLGAMGWWEQPEQLDSTKTWEYHPVAFGRYKNRATNIGGAVMAVFDANGDNLNDVVTQLNVHGFGMAWYEQKRDSDGNISFIRHMVHDDYSFESVGGVTFSQGHASTFADMDNDGVMDYIVGKRQFTHLDNLFDPDAYGPPVVYWYRTVMDPNAEGGARLEPNLIHNRSGVGSQITAIDLNNDGKKDLLTSTNRGTFVFWNTMKQD